MPCCQSFSVGPRSLLRKPANNVRSWAYSVIWQPDDNAFISTWIERPRNLFPGAIQEGGELDFAVKSE
jgi:hypothetical protein